MSVSRHDSEARIQSAALKALHFLQAAQIEHQGHYSTHRLRSFQEFIDNKFSVKRLFALLFVTSCPSIVIVILLELAPLNAPSAGPYDNAIFWARFTTVSIIMGTCYLTLTQVGVPMLNTTNYQGMLAVVCAAGAGLGTLFVCAIEIGFPVPFSLPITSVPSMFVEWTIMGAFSFRRIRSDPNAILTLKEWHLVSGLVATQFFLYPLYNYLFRLASSTGQTALSIILEVMKIAYKVSIGKAVKQQADNKAEIVTFNAEIGHAMFVVFSMQNATSVTTVIVLLLVDLLHSISLIYDVHVMAQQLEALNLAIHTDRNDSTRSCSIVDRAIVMLGPISSVAKSASPLYADTGKIIRQNCLQKKNSCCSLDETEACNIRTGDRHPQF